MNLHQPSSLPTPLLINSTPSHTQPSGRISLYHVDLQLFDILGSLRAFPVLQRDQGVVEILRSCSQILLRQSSHFSHLLARYAHQSHLGVKNVRNECANLRLTDPLPDLGPLQRAIFS